MRLKRAIERLKNKMIYSFGVHFPYSKVRRYSLKLLGFDVGNNVYFPSDLVITQNFCEDMVKIKPLVKLKLDEFPRQRLFDELSMDKIEAGQTMFQIKDDWMSYSGDNLIHQKRVEVNQDNTTSLVYQDNQFGLDQPRVKMKPKKASTKSVETQDHNFRSDTSTSPY